MGLDFSKSTMAAPAQTANALKEAKAELKRDASIHTWSVGFKPKKFFISLKATEKTNEYDKKP